MPRRVDATERRLAITTAAVRILARGGSSALTLRSLAEELDGSITLVTHFFSNRSDLFAAIVDDYVESYDAELAELERGDDAPGRLRRLLHWMLPLTPEDIEREAGRIALISMREDPNIDHFFVANERRARELLTSHLDTLLPPPAIPHAVDVLRSVVNGLVLSAVEHPDIWTARRQLDVIETTIRSLEITHATT
jgi:AcrR family transcriptional regulator